MKIHECKTNPYYIAGVVTGIKDSTNGVSRKKKLSIVGLCMLLAVLVITTIAEYGINKEKSLLGKILLNKDESNQIGTLDLMSKNEKKNAGVLSELKKANDDYKHKNNEIEEQLKKYTAELTNKNDEVVQLTSENSKLQAQITSIKTELSEIKIRKKKLDDYTKSLINKKSTLGTDMKKMIKFKVDAEKRKLEKEKKKILITLKQKEKELEELKMYVEELESYRADTQVAGLPNDEVSDLKAQLKILKENMHYNSGTFYEDLNMFEDAIEEYKKAIEINPKASDAHYNIAVVYDIQIKDNAKALWHYNRYLELEPDTTDSQDVKKWIVKIENIEENLKRLQ